MLLATLSNFGIGTNQRDLSLALNSSTENVGAMLNLLEENDFVRRTSNARDKRSKTLTISEKGYAALDEAAAVAAKLEKKILAGIDRNELRVAEKVLVQVQLNLAEIAKLTS
jgi:MarR family transcriptional regulator for hemolysin